MPYFAPILFSPRVLDAPGHLFRDHAARADARNVRDGEHTAWNVAADTILNLDLVQAGCRTLGQKGILPAKLGLPDGPHHRVVLRPDPPAAQPGHQQPACREALRRFRFRRRTPHPGRSTAPGPARPMAPATWNAS